MNKLISTFIGFFIILHVSAETIYEPVVITPDVPDVAKMGERDWRLGLGLGQVMPSNLDSTDQVGVSANYLFWNNWYVNAELWYSEWAGVQMRKTETLVTSFGIGYDLFQGAVYIAKGITLPWTAYGQFNMGDQATDGETASYMSGTIGWRLAKDNNYAALEWKRFSIDDDRLEQINSDKGYQWSIQFGR